MLCGVRRLTKRMMYVGTQNFSKFIYKTFVNSYPKDTKICIIKVIPMRNIHKATTYVLLPSD